MAILYFAQLILIIYTKADQILIVMLYYTITFCSTEVFSV